MPAAPTQSERHKAILRSLTRNEPVSVTALARVTGVSAVTIRRDLTDLSRRGLIRRLHGGATLAPRRGTLRPFAIRQNEDPEAKELLAKATANLIEDGESLIIDNGTTCELIAQHLAGRELTVLALCLRTAAVLAEVPGVRVIVAGGAVETETLAMITVAAVDAVRDFRADTAILGACAASPASGLCTTTPEDAAVKRAIIASAARSILPTTVRKLTRTSTYRFGDITDLSDLLTTADAPAEVLSELRAAGVEVSICR